jgi:lipopolysaccharide biosynthesis regulator YciM
MWEPEMEWFLSSFWPAIGLACLAVFLAGLGLGLWKGHSQKEKPRALWSRGDQAFFKGFQYILSNDQDQAIEEFTKSVQVNSETVETYMALGNLYRSKGSIDRAIQIRQSILARPNVDEQTRLRVLFDLGLDYRKGGFLNRALSTFLNVIEQHPRNLPALREIERLYEETRDWRGAHGIRQKISRLAKGDHSHILAHHLVELGKTRGSQGDWAEAKACFKKAISTDRRCVDAYLHLGDLHFARGKYKKAMAVWRRVAEETPQLTFLAYQRIENAYATLKDLRPVGDFLRACARLNTDAFSHLALAGYLWKEDDAEGALRHLGSALELEPGFWEAHKLKADILIQCDRRDEALAVLRDLAVHLNVPYLKFQCTQCGFQPAELHWQCPQCRSWDTIGLVEPGKTAGGVMGPVQSLGAPRVGAQREA